jgi:ligand-binding sensor domain-containing protein
MKKYISLFLIITAHIISEVFAGVGDWTTFTNQGDVRDILINDNDIWCATNGGVFRYEISSGEYFQFNNTNGMSANDAQAIELDKQGKIWIGFSDGSLNNFFPETNTWEFVQDYIGHFIYDLQVFGDSLLVALDIGVSLYDIKKAEVKETYKNLGWHLPVEIPVKSISMNGRDIWIATESGIAASSFDLANLMAPESWTNYTISHGLPSKNIQKIVVFRDSIFAATDNGIALLVDQMWLSKSNGLPHLDVKDIVLKGDSLYALTTSNLNLWNPENSSWTQIGTNLPYLKCMRVTENNIVWIGRRRTTSTNGFAKFSLESQEWFEFTPPGPPGNQFHCLAMDANGVLWCGTKSDGVFRYDGTTWQQFTKQDGLPTNYIEVITIDSQNRKWLGTTGGGVAIIDEYDSLTTVIQEDHLSDAVAAPNYIVITDIKIDRYGNIWILNLSAANNKVVAVYSAQLEWQYFTMQEGILNGAVRAVDFDSYDRIWVASDGGVNVIDYNNTLMYKDDDDFSGTLTTMDGLEANHVKDIAIDLDDIVWIATESGLNYWVSGDVNVQYGILSNSVNKIEVDVRNNKWFGTSAGVSVLAPDGYTWTHYSTDNSQLVSDNVTSFAFDNTTGKVYIATTNGLSCLETPYSEPLEDLSKVIAGPNPFIPDGSSQFVFLKLADDVAIKIMTENGMVVRQISKDEILGSQAYWDGKTASGEIAASGIYIYVIYNEDSGLNSVGKIALIH